MTVSSDRMKSIPVEYFNELRENNELIDLFIVTQNGARIPAHRTLLCAQYPHIKDEILKCTRNEMELRKFPTQIVQVIVDFAYTGKITIDKQNVVALYLIAHNIGSKVLIDECKTFIMKHQPNVSEVWKISAVLADEELRDHCLYYISQDFDSFILDETCLRLTPVGHMEALLKSPWLWMPSDESKLKALARWISVAPDTTEKERRESYFIYVLPYLDFNELPRNLIVETAQGISGITLPQVSRKAKGRIFINGEKGKDDFSIVAPLPPLYGFEVPFRIKSYTVFCNGFLYITGGKSKLGQSSPIMHRVNPIDGEVRQVHSMNISRYGHSAAVCNDKIFVFGGVNTITNKILDSCEKYSPLLDSWESLANMPTSRLGTGAVHVPGTGIFVLGGRRKKHDDVINTVEMFDLNAQSWRNAPEMLYPRLFPAVEYHQGKIFAAGCKISEATTAEYLSVKNGQIGQWTSIPDFNTIGSRPFSMTSFEDRLYFSIGNKIYEMTSTHEPNGTKYVWKELFKVPNLIHIRLFKVMLHP